MSRRGRSGLIGVVTVLFASVVVPARASGQVTWQDLVFTGGISGEVYRGNLPSVTVLPVDSTNRVSAAVGEFGVRGNLSLFNRQERGLSLQFDAGLRQFAAGGFRVRDYAPREWVGRLDLSFRETVGDRGDLAVLATVGSRKVDDRPPIPLFLQPGYGTAEGRVQFRFARWKGAYVDAQVFGEITDYGAIAQLDLLDRKLLGAEVGATWQRDWTVRAYAGFRAVSYGNQGTFDPSDPFRRDKTFSLGATWIIQSRVMAEVGLEGTLNRSNSSRPEYNAVSVRSRVTVPMPQEMNLNFFAVLTAKGYLTKTDFARLVPGEEADNASVVYAELARPLAVNLDGAVRFGWNRAERDIGNSYFERFGATFLLRYRPRER